MKIYNETIGRLRCTIVDSLAGRKPSVLVILCHGYGATGTDLVPIGEALIDQSPQIQENIQFVFPEAPLSLEEAGIPGGRAWWQIDLMRLQLAAATGRFREMQKDRPAGMIDSRDKLLEVVNQLSQRTGLSRSRIVLGGFSQGAMLATDVAMNLEDNLGALIALSGTLLNESEWQSRAPVHSGLRVLQSHGRMDPLLPFDVAQQLSQLLANAGANVEFIPFAGGHEIPYGVFERIAELLESMVSEQAA